MKNPLLVGALALLCVAAPAQAGLDLGWNDCATDGGSMEVVLPCSGLAGAEVYGTFQLANALNQFIALDFSFDLQTETIPSGNFWNFGGGECNDGNLLLGVARQSDCSSASPVMCSMTGAQCQSGFAWATQFLGPNRHRIVGSIFRDAADPVALAATTNYFALKFTLFTFSAVEGGAGTCAGCTDGAGLVWSSALASGLVGTTGTEVQEEPVEGPGLVGNCVTMNGGRFLCGEVTIGNRTWGQIKSFYR